MKKEKQTYTFAPCTKTGPSAFPDFLLKDLIMSCGLANGITNGIICWFLTKPDAQMNAPTMMLDFLITTIFLTVIMGLINYPAVRRKYCEGSIPDVPYEKEGHMVFKHYREGKWGAIFGALIGNLVLVSPYFVGIAAGFNLVPMNRLCYSIYKGVFAFFLGCTSGYYIIIPAIWEMEKAKAAALKAA